MPTDDRDGDLSRRLTRRAMPDGGEVVGGALAQEALDAVGARAMTLDRTIVVGRDFDPDDVEDQALYAHEAHHRDHSGGTAAHQGDHDEEERRAREIEARVLHLGTGGASPLEDAQASPPAAITPQPPDPIAGYRALRTSGLDHEAIVRQLARGVVEALRREDDERVARGDDR